MKLRLLMATMVVAALGVARPSHAALIGSWNFIETSGTVAHDSSGSGINGTLGVGAVFDPGAGPGGGGAVSLTNGQGYVTMGNQYAFAGTDPFSIQVWAKLAAGESRYMLPLSDNLSGFGEGYILELNRPGPGYAGHADAYSANGQPANISAPSPAVINDGQWHQIVGVYDSATVSLYVDGRFQTALLRGGIAPGADFVLGGEDVGSVDQNAFTGFISDAAVWNNALSASDVHSLYRSTLGAVPEPSTWLMMLTGLGLIGSILRRRHVMTA